MAHHDQVVSLEIPHLYIVWEWDGMVKCTLRVNLFFVCLPFHVVVAATVLKGISPPASLKEIVLKRVGPTPHKTNTY